VIPTLQKAVIPAAGFGTRMLPAAKSIPKEMLPVLDRPTIQYVVEEAADAGVPDILLVTSRDKKAVEDHFDRAPEVEQRLAASNKSHLLDSIKHLMQRVKVHSVRQQEQKGLGHAVLQARHHVGDHPFLCLLGDTLFSAPPNAPLPATQLADAWRELGTPLIALEQVPQDKVDRYGIVAGQQLSPTLWKITSLIEKPPRDQAPTNLAICARYILTPDIFDFLDQTPPGKGGEIQLTDALNLLLQRRPIHGVLLQSTRHDIGNPIDWLKTNITFARQTPATWHQLLPLLHP